jgi:hexosaminidase
MGQKGTIRMPSDDIPLLPQPAQYEPLPGRFALTERTAIQADEANRANAEYLRKLLAQASGFPLPVRCGDPLQIKDSIRLTLNPGTEPPGEEGYQLEVQTEGVTVSGRTQAGVFRGLQTIRQLLPTAVESPAAATPIAWSLPACRVADAPRFVWRGFMLDEGRHFQGKQAVLELLDLMALFKLNVFHWHLTEDQGWRIEIQHYPRLNQIGSSRPGTSQSMFRKGHNGIPHAGFYTQKEIREIVAYAAERHIQVVPEIEIPGHSLAALAAYPELSCTGGPFAVATRFGIFPDIYCAGKEATFEFLQNILDEILDLFPSPWIHIGGDEAPKARWKNCPDCQARIAAEGLADEDALQAYMTNRVARYLENKGRTVIGWNQILHPGLVQGAVAQYWVGGWKRLLKAIREDRRRVIMSSYLDTYLDHGYSLMPLSRAYRYEPVPHEISVQDRDRILGLEFPLWGEWLPDLDRLHYQAFPRLSALAETGWTPAEAKCWPDFRQRVEKLLPRLDRLGIRYAPLSAAEPPRWKRIFGLFSIAFPQTGRARPARPSNRT